MKAVFTVKKAPNAILALISILLFSLIISSTKLVIDVQAPAPDQPTIFVEPASLVYDLTELHVNDTIQINVTVSNMTGLCGLEFKLEWNSTILKAVDMEEYMFHHVTPESEWGNIWKLKHVVADDYVWYAYTWMDMSAALAGGYAPIDINTTTYPPEGKLTAAIITLQVVREPTKAEGYIDTTLTFTIHKAGDVDANPIDHVVEDGYFKFIWTLETKPYFSVEPPTYTARKVGEVFNVSVYVNNLDPEWEAVGFEFKLRYNTTLLEVVSVTEGPWLKPFGNPPNQGTLFMYQVYADYVLVGDVVLPDENGTWHEPFPSGTGVLAIITFNATYKAPNSVGCILNLSDTKIGDIMSQSIPQAPEEDGYYEMTGYIETLYHNITVDTTIYTVVTTSNATVTPCPMILDIEGKSLKFNVSGVEGAIYFLNVTIPKNLLFLENPDTDNWKIYIGEELVEDVQISENETHTFMHFTFNLTAPTMPVRIVGTWVVPEFSTGIYLAFLLMTVFIVIIAKKSCLIKRQAPKKNL